jgi:hypothetical protein
MFFAFFPLRRRAGPGLWLSRLIGNGDHKAMVWSRADPIDGVEPLFQYRSLQFSKRSGKGRDWYPLFSVTLMVSANGVLQRGAEQVRQHSKSGGSSTPDVPGTIGRQGVGIIHDKGAHCCKALREKRLFAFSRPQEIETDPYVGLGKTLAIEGGFSGALDSDKDDRLGLLHHGSHYLISGENGAIVLARPGPAARRRQRENSAAAFPRAHNAATWPRDSCLRVPRIRRETSTVNQRRQPAAPGIWVLQCCRAARLHNLGPWPYREDVHLAREERGIAIPWRRSGSRKSRTILAR